MRVKVAIDLALDRLFDYEVPVALQKKLAVGQLLSVPFGHREARGFAMAVTGAEVSVGPPPPHGDFKLKPVAAIVDETPFFSLPLLELVKRVAGYTSAPVESVLKAAVPAAVLKKNARPRELMFIEPALAALPVSVTKRQQWLYDQIVRLGGGWMSELCRELRTTPATIRELGLKGLVTVAVRARRRDPLGGRKVLPSKPLGLNDEQRAALTAVETGGKPVLLFGVTGSGKTEVYLQAIAGELAADRGAIVMVPEISLTPQTVQRFAARFGDRVAVLHSALSDGERYDEWHRIRSGAARVVVGPRSAVWAPVKNLGLIVVDEEHESSYKQEDTPRYHARDVAVLRGAIEGAKVVLGSATPSLESWMNVKKGKYALAELKRRAGAGTMPAVSLVEMTGGSIYSRELLEAVRIRLDRGEQTILLLNRRGYARSVECEGCGYVFECPECSLPYTYHRADSCLRCHVCGGWASGPSCCPKCRRRVLDFIGVGTQRAEAALAKCFPRARILRMDADSTSRKNSHDDILSAFRSGEADILLGTQMIAKGLDFPNVTLVGVLNADSSLRMAGSDFRAAERTFQLISQVAGRAGRAALPGEVIVQSRDVSVAVIRLAARGDYGAFAAEELKAREECFLPPHCHFAVIGMKSKNAAAVGEWAEMYAASLRQLGDVKVSGAMPCALEKADGWYRWQITLRSERASAICRAWRWISSVRPVPKGVRASLDMDAFNLV
ncbi:MAG: primosomal protein N' [Kiritimatiellae bacterium]|nr:primosomal protein N' [Kiritimatiellia bacterium]